MPKSSPITAPLRGALIECFQATTRLVRPELRRQLVLVGGAASIAHSSVLYTEDVDVAAPPNVLADIWESVTAGAPNFSIEPDGKIAFDASQGFRVRIDLIEYGKEIVETIHVAEPFYEGSGYRGSDGEAADFRWLLSVARVGQVMPGLTQEELEYICQAGRSCLGKFVSLLLFAILSCNDATVIYRGR
ncbi:hypothetical protein BJX61DRAFT_549220 [Aspergillus egyptiacus]|nr:hypothetical protein BJX61DRAFT_549220 [Aspergillus egyptiacus]